MFHPVSKDLFFKKPSDRRLGDKVLPIENLENLEKGIVIFGYPDDEGIGINKGRLGASQAPSEIRRIFYRMTHSSHIAPLYDRGDLEIENSLEIRHKLALSEVQKALDKNHRVMALGGGHDYGYVDGAGFLNHHKDKSLKPLIINVDAHLDVRPLDQGISSGTPFYRLVNEFEDFDLIELGIQKFCNSEQHIQWCEEKNIFISYLNDEDFLEERFFKKYKNLLTQKRPTYLSLDIDAFSSSFAPGASQSWPSGLTPREFFPFYRKLLKHLDIQVLGIYEVSPPLDEDHKTCKLASELMYEFLDC